ncbi:endo-1,3(4)-beta-glucanase 1-like [Argentina anserina]|uniref:endo-1,3(4)-beta-glucanase 1-like n=1 Tax=Argentina anserina TaxID=57926 RepID=UPI0021764820|nr:endo-1,3(4)-beta-glucanase 1-like [Potentilla anserina]
MSSSEMTLFIFILAICFSFLQTQAQVLVSKPAPSTGFVFPQVQSTVLPDPSPFFSSELLRSPLPTNSFFQNFVLNNGDAPEYFHPYSFRFSNSSLTLSYPTLIATSPSILQNFTANLTISAAQTQQQQQQQKQHQVVSSYSDLGVTLDILSSNLRFFLVKGSPYLTCNVSIPTALSISTTHDITSLSSNKKQNKHTINLNNNQTWLLYSSSKIGLTKTNPSLITSDSFSGVIRVALSPGSDFEKVLDQFSKSYPVSGEALFTEAFGLEYKWKKEGNGELLMLAHPLHLQILSVNDRNVTVLDHFRYRSIDGDLVGVVGDSWVLKTQPIPVTWHSISGIKEKASIPDIIAALKKDVQNITSTSVSTTASYFYGKTIAKAARLALIAEEVGSKNVIPTITKFLKNAIEPWLRGTFEGNGFLYEAKWGGLVTKKGAVDKIADFGFGIYNDHHYHIGYFLYAISIVAKLDKAWGIKFKDQAYSLAEDFMNLNRQPDSIYPRLRNFDLYNLHSWAGGLTEFGDGRNQESSSEAVNGYYSAALMGLAYGDTSLTATGSLLAALEILAAQKWWHVHQGDGICEDIFSSQNKITGIVWSNKRVNGLWFAPPNASEIRLGIQVLPISPITEVLFSNVSYVKELVEWTAPALTKKGVADGWKGFDYSLEGIYNKQDALQKIENLCGFDDGNSLTNLLWWIHSRG